MQARRAVLASPAPAPAVPDIVESINRVNDLLLGVVHLQYGMPEPSGAVRGWHRCEDLLAGPDGFAAWHAELKGWLHEQYDQSPDRTAAGYIRAWYLQVPGFLAAVLFHHERRVPSLRPQDLALQIAEDGRPHPVAIALRAGEFACLPDDPAAGTPAATVVQSEHALAALLRARFAGHAARFAAAFHPPVRFGPHTIWGAATDALDVSLWNAGRFGGDEGAGVADAALVLPEALAPFTSGSTLHTTCDGDDAGTSHPEWTRRKEACCFHYLIDGGSGACTSCPRVLPKR